MGLGLGVAVGIRGICWGYEGRSCGWDAAFWGNEVHCMGSGSLRKLFMGPSKRHLCPNPCAAQTLMPLQMLGLLDHQRELQEMLRDMPQILPPEGVMAVPEVSETTGGHGGLADCYAWCFEPCFYPLPPPSTVSHPLQAAPPQAPGAACTACS